MLNIEWTRAARRDLVEIVGFIANDNPLAARKMKLLIMEAVIPAARHPRLFRRGRVDGTHEIPLHPNYLLVYQVLETHIRVLRVLHARRQYP
ncbi:type II toxin-antitoxin system RelE/ParE family toxin [Serratia marcescens]|uniref:type II toxin-antitoxin system RelE/ParE family toxin n=1 Tax=Serratia marcescens TaxID=615 RepID=UPI0006691152|nr:type II toxin-antitoxin system RelE/ParE family toxin [Serratia marcescens]MBH2604345.1 type II toxin-antitoxin system RelE/ParE family toxin [Serratia marcescens]MBH2774488.1 type II toxin-antitoxin system RelE/ParE family toxin [Serratia marcescens]MBH2890873.1 type II toxin-antitoxin system RelE/ParE family toxin [Serratia marcescens]MBN5394012.1 type II toxin-antitoxin system RelE/ParE family toxin [Serratia marcescens]MCW6015414.1 type II toxin-antitoxin system RelE/ParE family toxin [